MGGRDKNFEDPMQSDQDMRKTRYGRRRFSSTHPLAVYFKLVNYDFPVRGMDFQKNNLICNF